MLGLPSSPMTRNISFSLSHALSLLRPSLSPSDCTRVSLSPGCARDLLAAARSRKGRYELSMHTESSRIVYIYRDARVTCALLSFAHGDARTRVLPRLLRLYYTGDDGYLRLAGSAIKNVSPLARSRSFSCRFSLSLPLASSRLVLSFLRGNRWAGERTDRRGAAAALLLARSLRRYKVFFFFFFFLAPPPPCLFLLLHLSLASSTAAVRSIRPRFCRAAAVTPDAY